MRIGCSLGSLLSIDELLHCAGAMPDIDSVWIPETWGMENFAVLGAVASRTRGQKLGSSVINVYSRSPAVIAMGAASVDAVSGGRFVLGLGTSSLPIVRRFHGYGFDRPLQRIKEYVEIIRLALSGKVVNYSGQIFDLKGFRLLIDPPSAQIPIYLAAVNQKMTSLAWDAADGVIFYLRPKKELRRTISQMQAKREIDVACQIITAVSEDPEPAMTRAKKTLSFYVAVGRVYREFLEQNGFRNECGNISDEYKRSGLKSIHECVPDSMVKSLCIAGTPSECHGQLESFQDAGISLPILQFNPVGDARDSFELFKGVLE